MLQGLGVGRACGRRASQALLLTRAPGGPRGRARRRADPVARGRGFRSVAGCRRPPGTAGLAGPEGGGVSAACRPPGCFPPPSPGHSESPRGEMLGPPRGEMPEAAGRARRARGRLRRAPCCCPGRGGPGWAPGAWICVTGSQGSAGPRLASTCGRSGLRRRAERVRASRPADPVALCR